MGSAVFLLGFRVPTGLEGTGFLHCCAFAFDTPFSHQRLPSESLKLRNKSQQPKNLQPVYLRCSRALNSSPLPAPSTRFREVLCCLLGAAPASCRQLCTPAPPHAHQPNKNIQAKLPDTGPTCNTKRGGWNSSAPLLLGFRACFGILLCLFRASAPPLEHCLCNSRPKTLKSLQQEHRILGPDILLTVSAPPPPPLVLFATRPKAGYQG